MRVNVNPFFVRATDYIGEGNKFLELFSPEILDVFEPDSIWSTVNIIRSAPGGGKTTLLRIFTPSILLKIQKDADYNSHYRELYNVLKTLQVFKENKPQVISSLISFTGEYSSLEQLELRDGHKLRLYYSLLNSRIILSLLRSLAEIKGLNFPDDLNRVNINTNRKLILPSRVPSAGTGMDYYNWACQLEEDICNTIDSVFPLNESIIIGFDDLFALQLFASNNISVDGEVLQERMLIMLDDVHNLTSQQRSSLLKKLLDKRALVNVWVSERLQALSMDEVFSDNRNIHSNGQTSQRDYYEIDLEQYWRKGNKFEKFCRSVADKRTYDASDGQLNNFSALLEESFDNDTLNKLAEFLPKVQERVIAKHRNKERYSRWIGLKNNNSSNQFEQLKGWRSLEILLQRDQKKIQTALPFLELSEQDLNDQEGADVKNAAALFLNKELDIPYYFSFVAISKLASSNIEQFLSIAGELFEDVISVAILKHTNSNYRLAVSPQRQEEIIEKVVKKKWDELPVRIPDFFEIKPFLEAIGRLSQYETFLPNAPFSPGVNGIAISMGNTRSDRERLQKVIRDNDYKSPYYKLAKVISTCITYNLLEVRLHYKCKGKEWMVLYLNRFLCVKYNLPLSYGGFREKSLNSLVEWLHNEYNPNFYLL